MTGRDPMEFGWWLASRASGIVALLLITLSVTLGLAMAGQGDAASPGCRASWPRCTSTPRSRG